MALTIESCRHCGSPVPDNRADGFCCAGCAYVFQLLHEQGFEHFYDLKGSQARPPVAALALRELDYQWLREAAEGKAEIALAIQGLSCVGCVWLVDRLLSQQPGGHRINVDMTRGEVFITCEPGLFSAVAFAKELQHFGYLLGPPRTVADPGRDGGSGLERRAGICGAFAMNAMAFSLPAYFGMPQDFMFAKWFEMVAAMSATLSLLVGGTYFAERAWRALRIGVLHIDTPITLGIVAAYLGSLGGWIAGVPGLRYFDFVAMFIFLMLGGRWVQQVAVARNQRKLLRDPSIPTTVLVDSQAVAVRDIKPGDVFEIRPGQAVPVACRSIDACISVSLEWINGESEAQQRKAGQMIPAGALNISARPLRAEAQETWEQSRLRKLLEARKTEEQRDFRLERLLRGYLLAVVIVGAGGALWWWLHEGDAVKAVQVMISVFVVSCPCALGVAAPFADDIAASRAERLGVFVRSLGLWKKLGRVRAVIFDKTGTLTLENPALINADALATLDKEARDALRHLISGNLHPVSRSLFDAIGPGEPRHVGLEVEEEPGFGLSFTDAKGCTWALGRPGWRTGALEADAVFSRGMKPLAGFCFRDQLRGESIEEVARLRQRGIKVFVLSGDREPKVAETAGQLRLLREDWRHGMTPENKARWIALHHPADALYLGDGANDSLAFDAALCAGSPVTGRSFLEHKADFYFLGHSMRFVGRLLDVAELHRKAVRRVFAFSVTYNLVTAGAGLAGHLNPLAAAVLMPLSSVATLSLVGWTFRMRQPRVAVPARGLEAALMASPAD
ncbi:MAG: copA [Verrucomicrobiaceae bacterium]|nr:copA [Verrucomicrobiaceae bacterium]